MAEANKSSSISDWCQKSFTLFVGVNYCEPCLDGSSINGTESTLGVPVFDLFFDIDVVNQTGARG